MGGPSDLSRAGAILGARSGNMAAMLENHKRPVHIEDLLALAVPSSVRISADGRALVYSVRSIDEAAEHALSRLWMCRDESAARPLTGPASVDTGPCIDPAGERVAFLRRAPGSDDGETALCVIPLDGGEAAPLVTLRGSVSGMSWSPDGRWLALAYRRDDERPEGPESGDGPLAIRVRRRFYKLDNAGFHPADRYHIYRIDTLAGEPALAAVTDPEGDWDDLGPTWSPDGERIAFASNRRDDRDGDPDAADIYTVAAGGGEVVRCTGERAMRCPPVWSPDGATLAYIGCVGPAGIALTRRNVELYRVASDGSGGERSLTAGLDRCTMNLSVDDIWGLDHWMQPPAFARDGRAILVPVADQGTTWIGAVRLDEAGAPTGTVDRISGDELVVTFDVARDAGVIAMITTTATEPGKVQTRRIDGGGLAERAWPLAGYVATRDVREPIELRVESPDGNEVHGWVLQPAGEGPFPLLLDIHGGPVVQFGKGFFHELQTFAAAGFAVAYANPRGSQGYGAEFCRSIVGDWGTRPMTDLMAFVDAVCERFPVDADRMGVLGGSYGGYMTNWIIAHSNRFKAACTQRTAWSMEAMIWGDYGCTLRAEFGAYPWEDPALYERMSPATYAASIETPVLILQGLADQRTPTDQGERMFQHLRALGKDAELVLFPGASHDLSRNGKPRQRVERLRILHDYFSRSLA